MFKGVKHVFLAKHAGHFGVGGSGVLAEANGMLREVVVALPTCRVHPTCIHAVISRILSGAQQRCVFWAVVFHDVQSTSGFHCHDLIVGEACSTIVGVHIRPGVGESQPTKALQLDKGCAKALGNCARWTGQHMICWCGLLPHPMIGNMVANRVQGSRTWHATTQ